MLDPNQKTVDLTDLVADFPQDTAETMTPILSKSEAWEFSLIRPSKPDPLRYPTVVKNTCGLKPDNKFYLYYAHHDVPSGIGCAVADDIAGPYVKLAQRDAGRRDSQVLESPRQDLHEDNLALMERFLGSSERDHRLIGDYPHLSSPCVLWNPKAEVWHMYFHSYRYLWPTGGGHQQTYLARCRDLASHAWEILKHPDGTWRIVLPATHETWMNSGSSYHNVCVTPDGRFLAFLNGTGGDYVDGKWIQSYCGLGFAMSEDGIHWEYLHDNPILTDEGGGLATGMIGYLGDGEYLVVWADRRAVHYGRTKDFKTITRDPRGPARWKGALISPWRDGDNLYLFCGERIYTMKLPVADAPTASA